MYLKSIEVQGFKSFANKIVFDFHNGITGIVGPNGSGKSNVADAVRWVLGEQSAKQLRGAKMEDVIFAGTQNRKPVGFAYVAITLDNSDHALPVEYDEVTVSRRVYRSGESEYKINGHSCRLRDVTEMFYDTGIGKEGYSIIGQGQIDKILSGKPDERRELFDEAAGIVKFKRRKSAAIKKLENERSNLVRVNDILSELEKQVGPLKQQSEKAKEYLNYKTDLKKYDVNAFLLETDRIRKETAELNGRLKIVDDDLEDSKSEYDNTKSEYEAAENQLNDINAQIDENSQTVSALELENQKLQGEINVFTEQIKTFNANKQLHSERLLDIEKDKQNKNNSVKELREQYNDLNTELSEYNDKLAAINDTAKALNAEIEGISGQIDNRQNSIYDNLTEQSTIKAENQKFVTMLEQLEIKKSELTSHIIKGKSDESAQKQVIKSLTAELDNAVGKLEDINNSIEESNTSVTQLKAEIAEKNSELDKLTQNYHREKSRLESLINITERYDGYGNSIKKIMELKDSNPGILGVIADIVKVEKQYETAIETALGGTIQNIVTDKEATAKELIGYLKQNKLGRATFLPLNAIHARNTLENEACINEKGVIGVASNLVRVSFEYEGLAKYLLGRILVVDNIDNALLIAKKYKYTLRIVTLEGEQLNPGGSMTGGAFRNSSNLLGRRREIEELKQSVSNTNKQITQEKAAVADLRNQVAKYREALDSYNKLLRETHIRKNTIDVNLKQADLKLSEIIASYGDDIKEQASIDSEIIKISESRNQVSGNLNLLDNQNEAARKEIENLGKTLEAKKSEEAAVALKIENLKISHSSIEQKASFINENIERLCEELDNLEEEKTSIQEKIGETKELVSAKQADIELVKNSIEESERKITAIGEKLEDLRAAKEKVNASHKEFFKKREELNEKIILLEKDSMRLHNQYDRLEESYDSLVDYMWNEYELTYSYALELKSDELNNINDIRKQINILKAAIKKLGDVNVNAIEEYKSVSERYEFMKTQHDDMIEAEESLMKVIEELDEGMRAQFTAKFEEIKVEFDKVFKELFGGGRGTIELVEGEDILEAGILIISQPPGKKLQNMMQLSGGEKALTAIALLFAIQNLKPSPFCLLDEIEAALDDSNVGRYANYLHKLTKHTQFIVITHRRGTMSAADRLYGITMQEKGVSTLVSVDLIENDLNDRKKES
ncbi:MAG TPA: chromosome segregation protein SMC [Eubacterium sp.]|nr:chromosome segregation protein SMC [Eubacterium sp.]